MSNWDPTPWAIGGGADNSAETARTAVWASTNGAEGIVGINDLKVVPFDVPGSGVNVSPGGLLALSRYAGGDRQTYTARLGVVDPVDVANTGSSGGRVDLVAVIIDDPSQQGDGSGVPDDPTTYQYVSTVVIPNVGSTVTRLQDVPGYTYATGYAIARVAQPASNGTITAAMITDLRQVANPRRDRQLNAHSQVQAEAETLTSTTQAGEVFPNTTNDFTVRIPEWATRMLIVGTWSQLQARAGTGYGRLWVRVADSTYPDFRATQEASWDLVDGAAGTSARYTYTVADSVYVPAALRGLTVPIRAMGRVGGGANSLTADAVSGIAIDVEFLESAA